MRAVACFAFIACLVAFARADDPIRIAVAANFHHTLQQIVDAYRVEQPNLRIELVPGSSGKHYAQIVNGAPFHLFFSADRERPLRLEREGHGIANSRYTYAIGVLALWAPAAPRPIGPETLRSDAYRRLALANPKLAPYGQASLETLRHFNAYEGAKRRLAMGSNVAQPFHFVAAGAADLGFVSLAQLQSESIPTSEFWIVPMDAYAPIEQQAILLHDRAEARAFADFCRSPAARALIEAAGYRLPSL